VTIVRTNITSALPEKHPPTQCARQTSSRDTFPILKETIIKLILGQQPLTYKMSVASITYEFTWDSMSNCHCGALEPTAFTPYMKDKCEVAAARCD
jgi:hypothetical protein